MSLFLKLVAASTAAGSMSPVLRDVRSSLLLPEEVPAYEFVVSHANRHGALPTSETIQRAGFTPQDAEEPPSYYFDRIRERFVYRSINVRHPALVDAMSNFRSADAVSVLRDMLSAIGTVGTGERYSTLVAEAQAVVEEYDSRYLQSGLTGITFGWPMLDEMTLGAMGGDLIVLAGRPSLGKSWMLNEIGYSAWRAGNSVLAVSMEMGSRQFVRRWMGRHLGINPNFIRAGQLSPWAERSLRSYANDISAMPGVSVVSGDMEKHVEGLDSLMSEVCPDMLLVDAAYLLTTEGRKRGGISKWEMISEVVGALKKLAIRHDRPVLISVQFNRNQKANSRTEPDLADIAGSDSIPQDASIVLGIRKGAPPYESIRRQIVVLKNREGSVGSFETRFTFTPPNMEQVQEEEEAAVENLNDWMP